MADQLALARFSDWLTRYGDGWETASAEAVGAAFTVGATFQPSPFEPLVRGRGAIAAWFESELARWDRPSFVAQVLGAGETYGVAHFRVTSASRAVDGVLIAALDDRGRCTSLRHWRHEGEGAVSATLDSTNLVAQQSRRLT